MTTSTITTTREAGGVVFWSTNKNSPQREYCLFDCQYIFYCSVLSTERFWPSLSQFDQEKCPPCLQTLTISTLPPVRCRRAVLLSSRRTLLHHRVPRARRPRSHVVKLPSPNTIRNRNSSIRDGSSSNKTTRSNQRSKHGKSPGCIIFMARMLLKGLTRR